MAHPGLKSKTLISFSAIFFVFFFFSILSATAITDNEAGYMLKLMNALTPPPSDWSNTTDVCTWSGVRCTSYANTIHIDLIDLGSMSLTGIIPSGLNSLSYLNILTMDNNSLSGPLPSLANLTMLTLVGLERNNFSSIPDGCFQGLSFLMVLRLNYNTNLAPWTIPTDLTHSSQLSTLELIATNLVGPLPDIFDSFIRLHIVFLSKNNLSGVLPKSFAQSTIKTLWLNDPVRYDVVQGTTLERYRGLWGTIDVLSSMIYLSQAWLQGNSFEGPIPDLSNCRNLVDLLLGDNRLTGVVPASLMKLSSLRNVSLVNNFLQGPLPVFGKSVNVSLGVNTTNGFCLDHAGPCDQKVTTLLEIAAAFGYPIQLATTWKGNSPCHGWSFITCSGGKIKAVNLAKQDLTGTISPAFGNLTDLQNLYLGGNNLKGSIPESLATLPQLVVLDVSNNNLSGSIPRFLPRVKFSASGNVLLGRPRANGTSPPPASSPTAPKTSRSPLWIAGGSIAGAGVVVIFVVVIYNRKRCLTLLQKVILKRTFLDHNVENLMKSYGSLAPKRYSYSEVKRMTKSFCDELGQGGYGTVYRASLTDGCQVAIKVLIESKGNGEEFVNEVASISKTSHVNIVSLLGFCYEMNKRALIYEFMPNGSLDKFIYKNGSPNAICNLDWSTLYQITIGIARGLAYLHQGCNTRILHLDIKPQNILLDEKFCPKIAYFGLAKICKKKESIVSILGTRGTPGFIAPEVFSRTYGGVSHKSDVYSYGMLILEVVGGRNNYDSGGSHTSEMYFPDWIYKDLDQGNIPRRCLADTEEENDMVMKITLVSLWCIQPNPSDRPSMSKVIEMLEGLLQSVPYPPKPILYSPERPPLQFSDISGCNTHETNSISVEESGTMKEIEFT